jgi:NAD(P)-dependent dehydrogenase (short-subunit alcohol dehydrogenase family)
MRHVLISGASSGIGKAAAIALGKEGVGVFAGSLNEQEAAGLRAEGHANLTPIVLDVTKMDCIDAAVGTVSRLVSPADQLLGLVNCAGIDINAPLHVLEQAEIMQMINVNFVGGILLTRAMVPLLRRDRGRLVFISSAMALLRTPMISIYCSTKTGIEGFADAMRLELIPVGVKVSIVEPGVIRTPLVASALTMLDKQLQRMSSEDRGHYEPLMRKIAEMSADPKMGSSTDVTTAAIRHALLAAKPNRRYRAGKDCKAATVISALPYAAQDWIQRKIYKI